MVNPNAMLWKTVTAYLQSDASDSSKFLIKTGMELDRLRKEAQGLNQTLDKEFVNLREANIHGLFFGTILQDAWENMRTQSGAVAAIISMVEGYAGAAMDTIIDWLIDNLGPLIEKAEDWIEAIVDWWTSSDGQKWDPEAGTYWVYNPIVGWVEMGPGTGEGGIPYGLAARPTQIVQSSSMTITSESTSLEEDRQVIQGNTRGMGEGYDAAMEHERVLQDLHDKNKDDYWAILNDSQTAANEVRAREGQRADAFVDSHNRLVRADRAFQRSIKPLWVRAYTTGYMEGEGMRKVLARGTW